MRVGYSRAVATAAFWVLLGAWIAGCGGGAIGTTTGHDAATKPVAQTTNANATSAQVQGPPPPNLRAGHPYLNDSDKDPYTDEDPDDRNGEKIDEDHDGEDSFHPENDMYHDKDDNISAYGPSASPRDKRLIAVMVGRYLAVARKADGAKGCALLYSRIADIVPEDYGQAPGPAYLRGKTCAVVLTKLFKHSHAQLQGDFVVTDARVKGSLAYVLLGSKTKPASAIIARRERGAWRIGSLLSNPLG